MRFGFVYIEQFLVNQQVNIKLNLHQKPSLFTLSKIQGIMLQLSVKTQKTHAVKTLKTFFGIISIFFGELYDSRK